MTYVPRHVPQADGSPSQWYNCWAAVGAWLTAAASRGRKTPTPEQFRRKARKPPRSTGGVADVERGMRRFKVWKRAHLLSDVTREQLRWRLKRDSDKLYGAESEFAVWPDEANCQPGFNDQEDAYHFIGIVAGERDGYVRVMDPLCRRLRWVKVNDVVNAIITYNDEHAGETKGTADVIVVAPEPKVKPPPDEGGDEVEDLYIMLRELLDRCGEGIG